MRHCNLLLLAVSLPTCADSQGSGTPQGDFSAAGGAPQSYAGSTGGAAAVSGFGGIAGTPGTNATGGSSGGATTAQPPGTAGISSSPDAAAGGDASSTASPDAASPTGEPPDYPDVPDPVFEAPWFPCPDDDYPEHAVVVTTHDNVVHTASSTKIDTEVALPEGSFKAIALRVELECPTGGICDLYDRRAVVEVVNETNSGEPNIGLMNYVTTYRFQPGQTNFMCSWTDVTAYASLLTGTRTIRSWLDTVVSPGHELGDGWQVSAELGFYPGPAAEKMEIRELYGKFIDIGKAPGSIDQQTPEIAVEIPASATKVVAQLTVTGHGWGPENTDNCAEFCRLDQTVRVNDGAPHVVNPFRSDCARNPLASLQQRNPTGSRNGWCPGAVVLPYRVDITGEVTPGTIANIDFGVQRPDGREYVDADPTGYNPNELVSLQLFMSTSRAP